MADKIILAEQTSSAFSLYESYGFYGMVTTNAELVVGEKYIVYWDNTLYKCIGQDASSLITGAVLLGNATALGLNGNNEPFIITSGSDATVNSDVIALTDTEAGCTHTFAVYQQEQGSAVNTVVLAEQTLGGFTTDDATAETLTPVIAGELYTVVWDGVTYICEAFVPPSALGASAGVLCIGNKDAYEALASDSTASFVEPFTLQYAPASVTGSIDAMILVCVSDECESDTHTVAVSRLNVTAVLEEQKFSTVLNSDFGIYLMDVPATIELTIGDTYTVMFDRRAFACTCQDTSSAISNTTAVGNGSAFGFSGNNEPFFIIDYANVDEATVGCLLDTEPTEHVIAIYQAATEDTGGDSPEEEIPEEEIRDGIVLKDRNGVDVAYYGIETVTFDTTTDGKQQVYTKGTAVDNVDIALDFSEGDMSVTAPGNAMMKSATIKQPDTLRSEYIKKGIEVAGIEGDFAGDIVDKTVNLDFSNLSDMVVEADEDTVMSKVTIVKPESLVPENIPKDVEIAGIVGTHTCSTTVEPHWIDDICFWDYDGTLILNVPMKDVKNLSELPTPPGHEGLVFREWNYTLEELRAADYPRDVGAIYSTVDGKTHAILNITNSSYRTVPIYFSQTVEHGVTIDWGDGATSTVAGTGVVNTTHTYSSIGTYEIVLTVSSGCTLTLGSATTNCFIGGSNSTYRNYLVELYIGDSVELSTRMIQNNSYLTVLTIPYTTTSIPEFISYFCYRLKAFIVPRNVNSLGRSNAYCLGNYNIENYAIVSLPETVETIGEYFGYDCTDIWRVIIPSKVTVLLNETFSGCRNLRRLFMPDSITSVGNIANNCHALTELKLPSNLTSIGNYALRYSGVRELVIPASVSTIGDSFASYSALRKVVICGKITSVGTYLLGSTYLTELILCTQTEVNTAITELINKANYYRLLYVPDSAVTAYKNALSTDYKQRIYPLSSYSGVIPEH